MVVLGYGHVEFSNLYSECNGRNVHCGKSAPLGTARVMTPKTEPGPSQDAIRAVKQRQAC